MELKERLIIQLLARDDQTSFEEAKGMWEGAKKAALEGHGGDCTHEPNPCLACFVERMNREVEPFLKLCTTPKLPDGEPKLLTDEELMASLETIYSDPAFIRDIFGNNKMEMKAAAQAQLDKVKRG